MADLIAYQDGNWTGATTWKAVSQSLNAKQATITSSTNTTTSYVASSTISPATTGTWEGVLLHCRRLNTTGTVSVALYQLTPSAALAAEVTVNASDLPSDQSWVFFKFASPVSIVAGTYNIRVKGSSAGNAAFFRDATAGNWARYIRSATTASAAATDVTFICDELTGEGAKTDITVTMDSTSGATSYGEVNIGQGGVLSYGTAASTNYVLDLGGNLNVWGGGTLNIGTSGTRIPSTSTAVLEFTMGTNVLYGLEARSGSTVNIYGATKSGTQALLTADAASGQKVITVNSTTGWAANDVIALASTTRTASQSEKATVSTVDSGTQATMVANLTNTHHGTGLYVGEVVNLTRNVKIRGTSQSLCAYVNCADTSSFTASYAEFYWLGSATASKRGIDSATTSAGTFSMTFCSMYDYFATSAIGFNATGASGSVTIEDCVTFLSTSGTVLSIAATSGTPSIQRNYFISTSPRAEFSDIGGTIKDNRFGGCGVIFSQNGATIGTIKDNVIHSSSSTNSVEITNDAYGVFDGLTIWRGATTGISITGGGYSIENANVYHNATQNISLQAGTPSPGCVIFKNSSFNGGSGASLSQTGLHFTAITGFGQVFDNCNFGNVQTVTTFGSINTGTRAINILFRKCTIADTISLTNQSVILETAEFTSAIKFDTFNNTTGSHRTYKRYGRTEADQATFKTAAPSEALLPSGGSGNKLTSGSKKFAVADATTATITVYVYKSASYNGNQPRLIVKANSIAGITTDTVLATASGGTGSWLTLTGTTDSVDRDCVLEVYVDCDGTAGTVYVDDWSIS